MMTDTMMVRVEICPECHGEGYTGHPLEYGDPFDTTETCPLCKGSGEVVVDEAGKVIGPYKRPPLVVSHQPAPF